MALCEEEGQEQAAKTPWQSLQKEATFTTVGAELQGSMSAIAPNFDYVTNDTIWNRTLRRPVYGPKSQQAWQEAKANQINGPFNSFRIRGDSLYFYPVPAVNQSCFFEYQSAAWVSTSVGGVSSTWTNDADTPFLDDQLMILGLIWRWKEAKGLDFLSAQTKYEKRVIEEASRDASKPKLYMDGATYDIQPVVLVPRGSFGV